MWEISAEFPLKACTIQQQLTGDTEITVVFTILGKFQGQEFKSLLQYRNREKLYFVI